MRDALIIGATAAVFAVVNFVVWRWEMHRIEQSRFKPEYREPFRLFKRK